MSKSLLVSLFVSLLLCIVSADTEPTARLMLYKFTETNPVVEGQDFVVTYQIFNTGDATASDIEVVDKYDALSFVSSHNINEEGNIEFTVDELAPGGETKFNITMRPKLYGTYDSPRARIKYLSNEVEMEGVDSDYRSGYSTALGKIKIFSIEEHARNTSYYIQEWALFFILYSLLTVVPYIMWTTAKEQSLKYSVTREAKRD